VIVSVRLRGKVHSVGVVRLAIDVLSETDVFVEGRDHSGAVVLAIHALPDEARELRVQLARAARRGRKRR
jgi:hypothetical protein